MIVPPHPGLASAFGTLLADRRVDRRSTHYSRSDAVDVDALAARLEAMERDARAALAEEGFAGEPAVVRTLSLRYAGQNYERRRAASAGQARRGARSSGVRRVPRAPPRGVRLQLPGRDDRVDPRERVGARPGRERRRRHRCRRATLPPPREVREVGFAGGVALPTPVFRREDLPATARLRGPAIVEELDSTTLVLPDQELRVLADGTLRLSGNGVPGPGARSTASP